MANRTLKEKKDRLKNKEQIQMAHEMNGDWKELAIKFGIAKSTAYDWIKRGDKPDGRGGAKNIKICDIHKEFFVELIEDNPRITLREMKMKLADKYNLLISKQTISRHLDALMYTLKDVRYEPERANSEENKYKRKIFVEKLLEYQSENIPIIFMDESNFNIHISRSEGRSLKGTRCTSIAAGSKGANIHIIGCISNLGFIYHVVKRGSFKKIDAILWMKECLKKAMDKHDVPVVVVIDNAPCHSGIEQVLEESDFAMNKILRLAPYSPMLNHIENIWSVLKSNIKQKLSNCIKQVLVEKPVDSSIREYRLRTVENLINESLPMITPSLCANCIAAIQRKIPDALNLNNVTF